MTEQIEVKLLSTGYFRAQGDGPCEWAQWPATRWEPRDDEFFPEASPRFRQDLHRLLRDREIEREEDS